MSLLILLRHGQSTWNLENRFTGWVDVPLSENGRNEALHAGRLLAGYQIDQVFTSVLERATQTAEIALSAAQKVNLPTHRDAALNERHYGDLQGLDKDETRRAYGVEQVHIWRRSFDVAPPNGESLKDTCNRVVPYFETQILPQVLKGQNVLVVAHGNSLRGLIKALEGLSDTEIVSLEIPTGVPIVYELDKLGHIQRKQVLGALS